MRIGAFYLGNWLTDVSQCVDPVAYGKALHQFKELNDDITKLFKEMDTKASSWVKGPLDFLPVQDSIKEIRKALGKGQAELLESVRALLKEGGRLGKAFHAALFYVGYFKFVFTDNGTSEKGMDRNAYERVFKERFRQYYPHEHLDRPELKSGGLPTTTASGPHNHSYAPRSIGGDLYSYLRTDIKLIAGLLAQLDSGPPNVKGECVSWAAGTFHHHDDLNKFTDTDGSLKDVDDTNVAWNQHLALLGHALHGIEDYFAHSTFVEHAISAHPTPHVEFDDDTDNEIYDRRLRMWINNKSIDSGESWKKLKYDTNVVTGYFDFRDTLISLTHVAEKLFGRAEEAKAAIVEYDYQKLLGDTLEFCADPQGVWDKNDPKNPTYRTTAGNQIVRWLREHVRIPPEKIKNDPNRLKTISELVVESGPLSGMCEQVKTAFKDAVRLLGENIGENIDGAQQLARRAHKAFSIYQAVTRLTRFITEPLAWLKELVGNVGRNAVDFFVEPLEDYLEELILTHIGAKRIGCHSLIAKDSGPELFHEFSTECAKAVHWYVIRTLIRHADNAPPAKVSKSEKAKHINRFHLTTVDWLELVEFFLCHPMSRVGVRRESIVTSGRRIHVTSDSNPKSILYSPDSLESLALKYSKTFKPTPGGPQKLTWEVIADANLPTKGMSTAQRKLQINKWLKESNIGIPLGNGNYAFRAGEKIVIPYQELRTERVIAASAEQQWWYEIMMSKNHAVAIKKWFPGGNQPIKNPHSTYFTNTSAAREFVKDCAQLRSTLEGEYNNLSPASTSPSSKLRS